MYSVYPKSKHDSHDIRIRLNSICPNRWYPFLCFISCPCPSHFYYTTMTLLHDVSQFPFRKFISSSKLLTSIHSRFYFFHSFPLNFFHYATSSFVYSFFTLFCTLFYTHRLFDPWFLLSSEKVPREATRITVDIPATSQTEWLQRVELHRSFDLLAAMMIYHATSDRVHFCTAWHTLPFIFLEIHFCLNGSKPIAGQGRLNLVQSYVPRVYTASLIKDRMRMWERNYIARTKKKRKRKTVSTKKKHERRIENSKNGEGEWEKWVERIL